MANLVKEFEGISIAGEGSSKGLSQAEQKNVDSTIFKKTFIFPPKELTMLEKHKALFDEERQNLERVPFSFDCIKHNDELVMLYTGLPRTEDVINMFLLFSQVKIKYFKGWIVGQLTRKNQIFMTLMKLKMNLPDKYLALRFKCSLETVTNTVLTWLFAMHKMLYEKSVELFKDNREPTYNDRRLNIIPRLILGFTTVYGEVPSNLKAKTLGVGDKEPFRGLLCIAPNGAICFASSLYTWFSDERQMICDCGILNFVKRGDLVMTDESFQMEDLVPDGVLVNRTPNITPTWWLLIRIEVSRREVDAAASRIRKFEVLDGIPPELQQYSSTVWQVCSILSNWQR